MLKRIKALIIFMIIIVVCIFMTLYALKTFVYKTDYIDIINQDTSSYLIDPYLILSIIKAESNFNNNATSNKGACGLMQLMENTASEIYSNLYNGEVLDKNKLYDERLNIILGTKYFSNLVKKYNGNYYIATAAYNAGIGNVDKWILNGIIDLNFDYKDIDKIPYLETKNYTKNVINNYKMYKFLY